MVRKLCFKCGLYWQGLTHDLSKYSPVEFWNGVKFYTGTKSPHIGERKEYGYSKAWLHHKGRNKHHVDYWQDIMPDGYTEPIQMPTKYFVEMLCDRVAASMIYLGDKFTKKSPLNYYSTHYHENKFHPETREKLEYWLMHIDVTGVDKTFNELKEILKEGKKK
jgi:hypothetical protein